MRDLQISTGNRVIAIFMGGEMKIGGKGCLQGKEIWWNINPDNKNTGVPELGYSCSWDWLIPS